MKPSEPDAASARAPDAPTPAAQRRAQATLIAVLLGFFVITLDAVVVNVALPTLAHDLGASVDGLQWVVDGYTLMFGALLLSAGALVDRIGARRAFGLGLVVFILASMACGGAPTLATLVVARLVQGAGAAVMMPASMSLIRQAYPDPVRRGHAVALWAMGGSVASTSGPVIGGWLVSLDWRWIFFVNLPVGLLTLAFLARTPASPRRASPFDAVGQVTAILAMGALIYGAIEAGAQGLGATPVLAAFVLALAALAAFVWSQRCGAHPMVPPGLLAPRNARISMAVGFTFMVGYFGLPFVMSLYLQQHRGLSAPATGIAFLPMMLIGLVLTPFSARLAHRFGARTMIVSGLLSMAVGLAAVASLPASAPVGWIAALMVLVGLSGPFVAPPVAAVLLSSVPGALAGTASGVFNTSRQVGGALAVAVFGALLVQAPSFMTGLRASLWLAAAIALVTAAMALRLQSTAAPEPSSTG
ncbi:MFS transporter [Xylella fastidiosa]|uniref:Drug:proton antiporter n=1 Tax=Xylella fastidiosa (strain 9a5c) TaxID=160492 RepID=Q9PCL3_XYLFA|nr:MFS transporter [Xylella fastidiosa]AAF84574.1 drug:proton antiporter [Xylella fastidiosa 9a5c]ALQ98190.2 MFS transporter [Xylella fastidiosa]ALR05348.2 MFS transporter [Xylella fastidiosa]ALR08622.2 MFS transporter [Xylella fastidiosa]ETE31678.1 MFS transporter [Xylella fastidiosa 32]